MSPCPITFVGTLSPNLLQYSCQYSGATIPEASTHDIEDGIKCETQTRIDGIPDAWRIDSEITTKNHDGHGRTLVPWDASSEPGDSRSKDLDLSLQQPDEHWNQFLANKKLFGVVSTYKEDLSQYTTALDISSVPIAVQKKAAKLAREIERKSKKKVDPEVAGFDSEQDEEALWSAVPRSRGDTEPTPSESRSNTKVTSVLAGKQAPVATSTVRGTFVHIDGVGLVNEETAQYMLWLQQVNSWQAFANPYNLTDPWHGIPTPTISATAPELGSRIPMEPFVPPGTDVVIEGLVKSPKFNGLHGQVESFDHENARYNVRLQTRTGDNQLAKVKLENLRFAESTLPLHQ